MFLSLAGTYNQCKIILLRRLKFCMYFNNVLLLDEFVLHNIFKKIIFMQYQHGIVSSGDDAIRSLQYISA